MKTHFLLLVCLATSIAAKFPDSYQAAVAPVPDESALSTIADLVQTLDNDEVEVEIEVDKQSASGPLMFTISSTDHTCSFSFDSLSGLSDVSDAKFAQINDILFGNSNEIPAGMSGNEDMMQQIECFRFLYESLAAANSDTTEAIRDFIVSQFYSQFMEGQDSASVSAFSVPPIAKALWMNVKPLRDSHGPSVPDQMIPEEEPEDPAPVTPDEAAPTGEAQDGDGEYANYQARIGYISKVGTLNNFDKLSEVEYIGNIDTVTYIDDLRKIDNVGSIDNVQHIENIDDIKNTDNIKNIANVGIIREIDSLEDIKNIEAINKIENIKSLDNLEDLAKIDYIDNIESIKNVDSLEDIQNINNVERINNIENVSIFSLPQEEAQFEASSVPGFTKSDIENVEVIGNIENVENLRNLESIDYIEEIKNIESVQYSKNMQADNVGTIQNIEHVSNIAEMLPKPQAEAYMDYNDDECNGESAESEAFAMQATPNLDLTRVLSKHERPIFVSKGSIDNVEQVKNVKYIEDPENIGSVKHIEEIHNVETIDSINDPKNIKDIERIENVEVIRNINSLTDDGSKYESQASEDDDCEGSDYGIQQNAEPQLAYTGLRVQRVKQVTSAASVSAGSATAQNGTSISAGNGTAPYLSLGSLKIVPTFILLTGLMASF